MMWSGRKLGCGRRARSRRWRATSSSCPSYLSLLPSHYHLLYSTSSLRTRQQSHAQHECTSTQLQSYGGGAFAASSAAAPLRSFPTVFHPYGIRSAAVRTAAQPLLTHPSRSSIARQADAACSRQACRRRCCWCCAQSSSHSRARHAGRRGTASCSGKGWLTADAR